MDVSKYRTRQPPKEHEEAVRMLLEGLEMGQEERVTDERASRQRQPRVASEEPARKTSRTGQAPRSNTRSPAVRERLTSESRQRLSAGSKNMKAPLDVSSSSVDSGSLARCSPDEDDNAFEFANVRPATNLKTAQDGDLEFHSEESGSQECIQVSPQIKPKRLNSGAPEKGRVGAHLENYESHMQYPLPKMQSKATSTASDSVSSSGASTDRAQAERNAAIGCSGDGDLNGNYEAIPSRTIAIQCDLKLSSVKRDGYLDVASSDVASMQASSISSTRYGFYRLSPEVLEQRRQLLVRSVSSRNIAEPETRPAPAQRTNVDAPTSISELSSAADVDGGEFEPEIARLRQRDVSRERATGPQSRASSDLDSAKSKHDQRFFSQLQRQQQVSSKSRQDSLPRRPKTALSYVSSNRLRNQRDDGDSELSHAESSRTGGSRRISTRAMSHQVLSGPARRRQTADEDNEAADMLNSNSDSELGAERNRLARQEELVVTRRGRMMGSSPQVSRSNTIRNGPLFRRATTLAGQSLHTAGHADSGMRTDSPHMFKFEANTNYEENSLDSRAPQRTKPAGVPSKSYSTDEEIQLANAGSARHARAPQNGRGLAGQVRGYGSMSLSRRPPHQQSFAAQSSCNLAAVNKLEDGNAAHTGGPAGRVRESPSRSACYIHRQSSRPTLLRRDRSGSQQTLPASGSLTAAAQRMASAAGPGEQTPVGRSSSMRQGRPFLGGHHDELVSSRHELHQTFADTNDLRRNCNRLYDETTDDNCCDDNCCLEATNQPIESAQPAYGCSVDYEQQMRPAGQASKSSGNRLTEASRMRRSESEDSESPLTRTWANPAQQAQGHAKAGGRHFDESGELPDEEEYAPRYRTNGRQQQEASNAKSLDRANSRSHSMRDVGHPEVAYHGSAMLRPGARSRRFESIYRENQCDDGADEYIEAANFRDCQPEGPLAKEYSGSSSGDDGGRIESLAHAQASHQPLDFDSQQRLNEIGLPEPTSVVSPARRRQTITGSASHLGLSAAGFAGRYATADRASTATSASRRNQPQYGRQPAPITGRAMSQQSLTRPTMPMSRRLRRSGGVVGGSDSDVAGSSISLANSKQSDPLRVSSRRASSRLGRTMSKTSGSGVSSQDRKGRSISRNGSDSESSSSMLRTLVKPRPAHVTRGSVTPNKSSRRRGPTGNHLDSDEENEDGIGQLASEIDSYKFRRRYSVPKDAKINWFSKLKQRVIASKS